MIAFERDNSALISVRFWFPSVCKCVTMGKNQSTHTRAYMRTLNVCLFGFQFVLCAVHYHSLFDSLELPNTLNLQEWCEKNKKRNKNANIIEIQTNVQIIDVVEETILEKSMNKVLYRVVGKQSKLVQRTQTSNETNFTQCSLQSGKGHHNLDSVHPTFLFVGLHRPLVTF